MEKKDRMEPRPRKYSDQRKDSSNFVINERRKTRQKHKPLLKGPIDIHDQKNHVCARCNFKISGLNQDWAKANNYENIKCTYCRTETNGGTYIDLKPVEIYCEDCEHIYRPKISHFNQLNKESLADILNGQNKIQWGFCKPCAQNRAKTLLNDINGVDNENTDYINLQSENMGNFLNILDFCYHPCKWYQIVYKFNKDYKSEI